MAVKQVTDRCLREAGRGFIISLKASNRYSASYLESLERTVALVALYAEEIGWPTVTDLTVSHVEEYLTYLQTRPRWFGEREGRNPRTASQGYIEAQYRRMKRFFNWLKDRGHIDQNPLNLISHPHIDERTVPTVSESQALDLLRLLDPKNARTPAESFRTIRNRAVLYLLLDAPGRRNEIANLNVNMVDLDTGAVLVMGKGRRERWMPLGNVAQETLWEYLQVRSRISGVEDALWVSKRGQAMQPNWLYLMLKRLGKRAGMLNLHTHQFGHTYAMNALRSGMPEGVLMLAGGWKRIPETYFRTLGAEDVARVHREISPADRLGRAEAVHNRQRKQGKARGKL